jgi:homoserine O-acetyltransferase
MSMGGMNAWQWAKAYPDMMDGVMPVVSLLIPVSGRNLLWRRMVIDTIQSDPSWKNGDYTEPPHDWVHGYRVLRMMIDSASALQREIPDGAAATKFLDVTAYKPSISMPTISCTHSSHHSATIRSPSFPKSARSFSRSISLMMSLIPTSCRFFSASYQSSSRAGISFQPGTEKSSGHYTMTRPDLWAQHVGEFMRWLGDAPSQAMDSR